MVFLLAAAAGSSAAFVPISLVSDARRLQRYAADRTELKGSFEYVEEVTKGKLTISFEPDDADPSPPAPAPSQELPQVFPGVHLPKNEVPKNLFDEEVQNKVKACAMFLAPAAMGLSGTPKIDPKGSPNTLVPMQNALIQSTLKDSVPQEDYNYFGNNDHSKVLTTLLKTNPFFASALTKSSKPGCAYELKSFAVVDPLGHGDHASLYRRLVSTLISPGHRVNFFFNSEMEIVNFKVFCDVTGKRIHKFGDEDVDIDYWASSALYNILFYVQCVHATIHVFHYLLTSAFQYVSEDFPAMNQWANYYANNIQNKYSQVGKLLIRDEAKFIFPPNPTSIGLNFLADYAALTGVRGFGAAAGTTRPIMADMLNLWGKAGSASAWFDVMMDITPEDMAKADVLTEFNKHVDLISPFAKDAAAAFREIDAAKTDEVESLLVDYLKRCGTFTSNIDSLEKWIELMTITGDVHGSTISFSRLANMGGVMRWNNIKADRWDISDINLAVTTTLTVCGLEDGRHTMTSKLSEGYDPTLQAVLEKHDGFGDALKEAYQAKIQADPEFKNFGWILSDFCTDGFDGKQLTTATYL